EPTSRWLEVYFGDICIAATRRGLRVLETGHPPAYYFPPEDVRREFLVLSSRRSLCEWKGLAVYYHVQVGDAFSENAVWSYPDPTPAFSALANYLAFYPQKMTRCLVDGEVVRPQPGHFYGGWITAEIRGPFKGEPGVRG
ncbi:MAG: DUF427 domain-containing protein, partial [Thermanaerothrix sp.]|nr:DUF427 domain-containing protein [Thermanaerothrix sp.]